MNNESKRKPTRLETLQLNLEYSFNKGVDLENRIIRLTEDIEEHHFDWFDAALTALESLGKRVVTLRISSYGGDVYSALGIIGRMRKSPCIINTEGYGKIMSAATAILAAGKRRSMSSIAQFMHHESSYEAGYGKESEHRNQLKESEVLSEIWCNLMAELTDIPKEFWMKEGVGKDLYLDAQQCKSLNLVDRIF